MILKFFKFLSLIVLQLVLLSSCISRKEIVYFQGSSEGKNTLDFNNKILNLRPQDRLSINVSAQERAAVIPFNLPLVNSFLNEDLSTTTSGGQSTNQTYVVNSKGVIDFPVLGEIKVSGLSIEKLKFNLTTEIAKYVKNPIVSVELENFNISVLGEVNKPGTFKVKDQSISLVKALGIAGDMTVFGKRTNVLVIREESDGQVTRNYVDITSPKITSSPYYYLKQNDVVYVEPNKGQIRSSNYRNASVYTSIAFALMSLTTLFVTFISLD